MRTLKMLTLAALAVVAAMAFAGAGTASAAENTVICQVKDETPCGTGNVVDNGPFTRQEVKYEHGVQLEAKTNGQTAELKANFFGEHVVFCKSSVTGYTTAKIGSKQLPGMIEELKFEECQFKKLFGSEQEPCTSGTEGTHGIQLQYRTLLTYKEQNNGWLYVYEHASTKENENQPGAILECLNFPGAAINCEYKVAEKELHQESLPETLEGAKLQVKGGTVGSETETPPLIIAEQVKLKALSVPGHESCPGVEPTWNASYEITSPVQGLFVGLQ